jgi:rfaE bifunctional protein nucleotidyltransferase chain/domain
MAQVILNHHELIQKLEGIKAQGKKIVLADGCFDLLHVGHVRYLRAAKALGDLLVLALYSDEAVKIMKGEGRPLLPLEDRLGVLAAFEMIDFITVLSEEGVQGLLTRLKPHFYARRPGKGESPASFGGKVVDINEGMDHTTNLLLQEILRKYGPASPKP